MEGTREDLIKNCKNRVKISIIPHYTLLSSNDNSQYTLRGNSHLDYECPEYFASFDIMILKAVQFNWNLSTTITIDYSTNEFCYERIHNYTSQCQNDCKGIENWHLEELDASDEIALANTEQMQCFQCLWNVVPENCKDTSIWLKLYTLQVYIMPVLSY